MITPSELRNIITKEAENIEGGAISDGFQSLMDYLDLDALVAWFVEIVCANNVEECVYDSHHQEAISDWYNKHCR